MRRLIIATLLLASLAGTAAAQAIPQWTLSAKPLTEIGVMAGDAHDELANVSSARRLPDGRIVIANGKPLELRVFDANGKFFRTIGHAGEGPGEYRFGLDVLPTAGDSIQIYTSGTRRWEWFSADGRLLGETPSTPQLPYPGTLSLYRGTFWVRRMTPLACVRGLIDRLPPLSGDDLREAFADGTGRYWTRMVGTNTWTVYDGTGRTLGTLPVPSGFEMLDAAAGIVVGKLRDADDVERVVAWRLTGWGQTPLPVQACKQVPDSQVPPITGTIVNRIRTDLRNYLTATEAFFSDSHRYPHNAEEMPKSYVTFSPGDVLRTVLVNSRGYVIEVKNQDSQVHCLLAVGDGVIAGFPSSTLTCSQ